MTLQSKLILSFFLLVLTAFFSGAEAALLSISRYKVRYMVEKKKFGAAYAKKLKEDPERLFSTILVGNSIVTTALASIATVIALDLFKNNVIAISIGLTAFLILVFGEITPKSIATNNNELVARLFAPTVWYLSVSIYPLVKLLDYFLKGINRLIGSKKIPIITNEELKSIIKVSEEEGTIKEMEKNMIQRIFDFDNITVSDVMTRKKSMVMVAADMPIKDVLNLPMAKMYSRLPAYDKNRDNIIGVLYLKDIMKHMKDGKVDVPVRHLMRKPFFVFENKKIDKMLHLFQDRKQHMAIVIDDKARIVGLVTIENILEEIVGEIIDESDKINPSVTELEKKSVDYQGQHRNC